MTVTINGTTGIAGVDGSAGTPAIQGADTNTGMFFPAADTIAFADGGVEVMRLDSSANLQFNSGYGSVATAYGCRAWCYFNGSQAIVASANFTSVTVNATGDIWLNFTTSMVDANYCAVVSTNEDAGTAKFANVTQPATNRVRVITFNLAGTKVNNTYNYCAVFR